MTPDDWAGAPGGALLLFFALIADAALPGGAALGRFLPHPRRLVASMTLELDRRLNRDKRSDRARVFRGALVVLVLAGAAATLGWLVEEAGRGVAYGWIAEFLVLTVMISQRGTFRKGRAAPAGDYRATPADDHRATPADDHRPARDAIEAVAGQFAARVAFRCERRRIHRRVIGCPARCSSGSLWGQGRGTGRRNQEHGGKGVPGAAPMTPTQQREAEHRARVAAVHRRSSYERCLAKMSYYRGIEKDPDLELNEHDLKILAYLEELVECIRKEMQEAGQIP